MRDRPAAALRERPASLLPRHPGLVPGSTRPHRLNKEPLVQTLPPGGPRTKSGVTEWGGAIASQNADRPRPGGERLQNRVSPAAPDDTPSERSPMNHVSHGKLIAGASAPPRCRVTGASVARDCRVTGAYVSRHQRVGGASRSAASGAAKNYPAGRSTSSTEGTGAGRERRQPLWRVA